MKNSLLIISLFLLSCVAPVKDKRKLDSGLVNYIEIRKQFDSVSIRLSTDQVANFVKHWNSSKSKGMYKFLPEYSLKVFFKGDTSISFRTSSDLIKMNSDWTYSVGDKEYFKRIWFKQAGLPDNYYEYFPIYTFKDKLTPDRHQLTEKHRNAIKQVLTYYKHNWIDLRGLVFYENKIDIDLLWNYTTKANDSTWLSTNK